MLVVTPRDESDLADEGFEGGGGRPETAAERPDPAHERPEPADDRPATREQRSTRRAADDRGNNKVDSDPVRATRQPRRDGWNVEGRIGRIASRQQGAIAHDQLIAAGLGEEAVKNWLRRGRLLARHRGVYLLAHEATPQYAEEMAAVLACRPRALVGKHTAAYMWGFGPKPEDGISDVTVVGRKARHREGIRIHRTQALAKADLRRIDNVPVVSAARALLDIAPDLTDAGLELAVHEALALKVVTVPELRAALARYPRYAGSARLRALVESPRPATPTDSKAAARLNHHLRRSGMPPALVDHPIGHWRPDLYWREAALAVEIDGSDFHSSRPRIERDHRKDAELKTRGIDVLRFTGRQVYRDIEFVLVTIARTYQQRLRG
jgi:very-short-patch-repair endonuclease